MADILDASKRLQIELQFGSVPYIALENELFKIINIFNSTTPPKARDIFLVLAMADLPGSETTAVRLELVQRLQRSHLVVMDTLPGLKYDAMLRNTHSKC